MPYSYRPLWPLGLAIIGLLILELGIWVVQQQGYGITYQVSSSMPRGLYLTRPIDRLERGNWVILYPPNFATTYLLRYHFIPQSRLLLKSIAAVPGDFVCQQEHRLWINQHAVAVLLDQDVHHQTIAQRHFCQRLSTDEYLVIGLHDPRSYDGRYFGPVPRRNIIAQALPLFTD